MSTAESASTAITADQLLAISTELKRSGRRCELLRGELRVMSLAGYEHGSIADEIAFQLNLVVRQNALGKISVGEAGFLIARDPDTFRAPDVAFVRADRVAAVGITPKYFPEAPALAVEVVSPSESREQVDAESRLWIESGCEAVWVLRPNDETVTDYRSLDNIRVLTAEQNLEGGGVVPGFSVKVAELFAGMR
ncbi:MAG: Uma2 family endonuclease [Planctomycetota bacterium]